MEDKNNLLLDLMKYLKAQNRKQRSAFLFTLCGVVVLFSAALLIQNLVWLRFVMELIAG